MMSFAKADLGKMASVTVSLALLVSSNLLGYTNALEIACYKLQLYSSWQEPSVDINEALSPLVGLSHDATISLFRVGEQSSLGVQDVAETGNTTTVLKEINQVIADEMGFMSFVADGPIITPGNKYVKFNATVDFPNLSAIAMLAPSPDWFTGVSNYPLMTEEKLWKRSARIELMAYDAGTDSGSSFTSEDSPTSPNQPISMLTDPTITNGAGFLVLQLDLSCSSGLTPEMVEESKVADEVDNDATRVCYTIKVSSDWDESPELDIDEALSPIILASHSKADSPLFASGAVASIGVQTVAETGSTDKILPELAYLFKKKIVGSFLRGPKINTPGNATLTLKISSAYPYLSGVAMIAPSPDWFIGINSYNLKDTEGMWKAAVTLDLALFQYDAGTDAGSEFTSSDQAELSFKPIMKLTRVLKGGAGKLKLTLDASCNGGADDKETSDGSQPDGTSTGSSSSFSNSVIIGAFVSLFMSYLFN